MDNLLSIADRITRAWTPIDRLLNAAADRLGTEAMAAACTGHPNCGGCIPESCEGGPQRPFYCFDYVLRPDGSYVCDFSCYGWEPCTAPW